MKYPLARVTWKDAPTRSGWLDKAECLSWALGPVMEATSVGYVVRDDEDCIVIVPNMAEDEFGDVTKIPRGMVLSVEFINKRVRKPKE